MILVKAVLDSWTVTEMESELQKDLLDTAGSDQGLEPDIFWYRFVAQEIQYNVFLFMSKAQLKARTHPNMLMVMRSLMKAWSSNSSQPLVYWDRIQRRAGRSVRDNPLHLDNGGEERWADINYYRVYQDIFSGHLDQYDPWLLDHRMKVNMNLQEREGEHQGKTFFRAFQGFLSLSSLGPGRGGIKVVPVLEEVRRMVMLVVVTMMMMLSR